MPELTAWTAGLILFSAAARYCWLIYQGHIKSSPAGWASAAMANSIGYIAYWQTPNPTWLGNIVQLLGTIEIWAVLIVLIWSLHRFGQLRIEFDRFQKICFGASLGILILWKITDRPDVAFFLVQALLVVSYTAVVGKVLSWKKNLDYVPMWVAIFLASSIGSVPALVDGDTLGIINAARAAIFSAITISIMLRIGMRNEEMLPKATGHAPSE